MKVNRDLNALASVLLAKAIKDLYPQVVLGEGIVDDNGFTYSFAINTPISIKELPKILKQMRKNIDRSYPLTYETVSRSEANKLFSNEKYKLEIIKSLDQVSIVKFGNDFVDICHKTNITKLSVIKAIELINVSGVYWKGNAKNEQLSSISGFAFEKESELKAFQELLNERKERDHRKLGSDLNLFTFDLLAGQGLPI
jgi:threonyl-tRNA synthetase